MTTPANNSLLTTTTPTYSGTAPAGSLVTVYVDNASIGTTTATGAIISAALKEAAKPESEGKLIVAIVCDFGERYISTVLYEDIRG